MHIVRTVSSFRKNGLTVLFYFLGKFGNLPVFIKKSITERGNQQCFNSLQSGDSRRNPRSSKGYGENQTTTYISCCAGNFLVSPLSKAKKGSLISITGDLSTELYQKKDGSTGESIKCLISSFYYIPVGDGKKKEQQNQNGQQANGTSQYQPNNSAQQQRTTAEQWLLSVSAKRRTAIPTQ